MRIVAKANIYLKNCVFKALKKALKHTIYCDLLKK